MESSPHPALIRAVDAVQLSVPDLEVGLSFYRDGLKLELAWRTDTSAGFRLPGGGELVVQTVRPGLEVDFVVESAEVAARGFAEAGGVVLHGPFGIQVGKAAVVQDPFGNVYTLLDLSKGLLATDADGMVIGNLPPGQPGA